LPSKIWSRKSRKLMEILLDDSLEVKELRETTEVAFAAKLINNTNPPEDFEKKYRSHLHGDVFHQNYLYYLENCYNNHLGYVITPDIFWNIILNEFATLVKNNVEEYRDLFTDSDEKKNILVEGSDPFELPMDLIMENLRQLVPTDVDRFIPEFSTSNEFTQYAHYCSFADMASPYYNYMMYCCGFSKVRIDGTKEDWELLASQLSGLSEMFTSEGVENYICKIMLNIRVIVRTFDGEVDDEFFTNIFSLEQCGSGHQVELSGWIKDFFMETPDVGYLENYSAGYAKVDYKYLPTNKDYNIYSGLFSSELVDGYLEPQFGRITFEQDIEQMPSKWELEMRAKADKEAAKV
jgi:hypothetical protein